jgi:IS5 family transposase
MAFAKTTTCKGGPALRAKRNPQRGLDFSGSHLAITTEYYARYKAMSTILDQAPELVDLIHGDLEQPLEQVNRKGRRGRRPEYTAENVLRILICQVLEGGSLREIVVRIDDSHFLRRFTRIDNGPMMDYTTLCKLKNAICEETWKKVNRCLSQYAVEHDLMDGEQLRLDTTVVETNIHWPADSRLLWDVYRVLARLIRSAREIDPEVVGSRRLQDRRAKRLQQKISRRAAYKGRTAQQLKPLYLQLIQMLESLAGWSRSVQHQLPRSPRIAGASQIAAAQTIAQQIDHYLELGERVVDQARRRIFEDERVPNEEKLFSIFEPHTELLKRGKAGKDVEFGHMIQIQQVACKFITDYDVFDRRPVEHELLEHALANHRQLFGHFPELLAGDKGYYHSMAAVERLENRVAVVSIGKKGRRTPQETEREQDPLFRLAQRFRAGVEGTISFLKRTLRMARCFNKGWKHFVSTIGQTILAHNLLVLARC